MKCGTVVLLIKCGVLLYELTMSIRSHQRNDEYAYHNGIQFC